MKGKKQPLLLLLAAGLVLLGGMLPRLAGAIQDSNTIGKVKYHLMEEVHLENNASSATLNMRQKLSLLSGYQESMQLPDSMAAMSKEELLQVVNDALDDYQSAGLIPATLQEVTGKNVVYAAPFLNSWDAEKAWSNVFWSVDFTDQDEGYYSFIVDDETATICSMNYSVGYKPRDAWDLEGQMEALARVYLEGLGKEFERYEPAGIARQAVWAEGAPAFLTASLSWGDLLFGERTISFLLSESSVQIYVY